MRRWIVTYCCFSLGLIFYDKLPGSWALLGLPFILATPLLGAWSNDGESRTSPTD